MNTKIKLLIGMFLLFSTTANALTLADIKNMEKSKTPEQIGLMIATEIKARDTGYESTTANLTMILKNAYNEESIRKIRNKTLEVPDASKGDKTLVIFDEPRDIAGTAFLTHSNILKADDQWLYLPDLKRVKRISSKSKSGSFMGSEFSYEDISSQEVAKYTYKYIAEEACDNNIKCLKVEAYPAYKYSGYTKEVLWIDAERFIPIKIDYYDRKKSLLKTQTFEGYHQYENKYWRPAIMVMKNHQNNKSTILKAENYVFKSGLKSSDFTKSKLKRLR